MKDDVVVLLAAFAAGMFVFVGIFTLTWVDTKNNLCSDLGKQLYARDLTWLECLVL